ncbi:sulfatase family protein [Arthrobacter sp. HLT1-20]
MNILLIMADQFAAHALDRRRDTDAHFRTPHLDRLAAQSTHFTQAYTPFPLCVPARSAMVTGKYPHQLGVMSNAASSPGTGPDPGCGPESLGHWFTAHGYDCAYAGKWHARQASASTRDGFAPIHPFGDEGLVEACTDWLGSRAPGAAESGRPYLLVASFDDPHTICEYARAQPMPYGDVPPVTVLEAPPLPNNFSPAPYAPQALTTEREVAARLYGSNANTADDWRLYRHAYAALVERVDRRIGQLLAGIDLARTAVVFVSDHGDGDSSHGWNQKTALYQECIRVPFLIHVPGRDAAVAHSPVSPVLGLLPTLCEVAGIAAPANLAVGSVLAPDPGPVVVQTVFSDADALPGAGTTGRALLLGTWKYTVYSWGQYREQLHNLATDPGEQRNLAMELAHAPQMEAMRAELLRWCLATGDTGFLKKLVLPAAASATQRQEIFAIPY